MTTHTLGPWAVGEEGDVFTACQSACIAQVCGAPEGIEEAQANAQLIAAAPEMLIQMQETVDIIRELGGNASQEDLQAMVDNILCDFVPVVDKATGQEVSA